MKEILKMIEEVSPNDTTKLGEIDALVWCWLNDKTYSGSRIVTVEDRMFRYVEHQYEDGYINAPRHTRSRDALKAIRPEGWIYDCEWYSKNRFTARFYKLDSDEIQEESPVLPTEELAELHAIIQAIEFERTRNV